ncbi:hypothetical protein DPX16_11200 [Anabarilius grahami]|uniref:Uncharacterized protein n=1 Tax=Anabarilius grahami TaxID=495550 RepID=A0A3N0Y2Q6_ANAGA|nr:hypothetical protein DPX16_11200 [Anabarilius grahami]
MTVSSAVSDQLVFLCGRSRTVIPMAVTSSNSFLTFCNALSYYGPRMADYCQETRIMVVTAAEIRFP